MSEYADKYSKSQRKERVDRMLAVDPKAKIDASGYTPPGPLDAGEKIMDKPKPRAYAKGGKVEGEKAHCHAGRKSRDSGGNIVNQLRPQVPTGGIYGSGFTPTHSGMLAQGAGFKKGGEAKKRSMGGKAGERRLEQTKEAAAKRADTDGTRPTGGRMPRKDGGRAKGKTNINIIIGAGAPEQPPMPVPPPPSAMPPKPPMGLPPAAMGAMAGPGAMGAPAGAAGPGMPPQMPPGVGRG